jgi:hypothetical protein
MQIGGKGIENMLVNMVYLGGRKQTLKGRVFEKKTLLNLIQPLD